MNESLDEPFRGSREERVLTRILLVACGILAGFLIGAGLLLLTAPHGCW